MDKLATEVNRNFKIKVNGMNFVGQSLSKYVGYEGLCEIIDNDPLVEKICQDALDSKLDVFTRRLRLGLTIRFYAH